MDFRHSARSMALQEQVQIFLDEHIYPAEAEFERQVAANRAAGQPFRTPAVLGGLIQAARHQGLWNLFLPDDRYGAGLSVLDYAPIAELTGRSIALAPEVMNSAAPDSGNIELLAMFANDEQEQQWLEPLLRGEIRSCFAMTEPEVASSDATNIRSSIVRDGDHYVINGRKWFISGAGDPRCRIAIFMGKTDPKAARHQQQSMILVPMNTPGITIRRMMPVFGYDDAPHGHAEITFENVRVPAANLLLGEGRGFEIAQGRLGPGRIHHCMRLIGLAERCLEAMCRRVLTRVAFGKTLAEQGTIRADIAESRMDLEQARLLTMKAAYMMDTVGNKVARGELAMVKVVVPRMALRVLDRAIQAHGAAGVCDDFPLAQMWAHTRTIRLADGPDEVHREAIAKAELKRVK